MDNLTPLKGNASRIKFLESLPGGAKPRATIGELTCELCEQPMWVKLDHKGKVYAFCNSHHPRNENPCGHPQKWGRAYSDLIIQHWSAPRSKKPEVKKDAAPLSKKPAPSPKATAPAGTGTVKRTESAKRPEPKPAARVEPIGIKPAPAGTPRGAKQWWDADD